MQTPFKFLDAYELEDADIFFGRGQETRLLYESVKKNRLVLVYGPSGTGKTSLVKCGLASRFDSADWHPIHIQRNENINTSLQQQLQKKSGEELFTGLPEALEKVYAQSLRPIYLIFDQLEELLIMGDKEEQENFISSIKALLEANTPLDYHILLILRGEFLGQLHSFEEKIPSLFDRRLYVGPMDTETLIDVVIRSCKEFDITLENPEANARQIIKGRGETNLPLTHLQVYLDGLWQQVYWDALYLQINKVLKGKPGKLSQLNFTSEQIRSFDDIEEDLKRILDGQDELYQKLLKIIKKFDVNVEEGKWPPLTFTSKQIKDFVNIEEVLDRFLDEQAKEIQVKLDNEFPNVNIRKRTVEEVLDSFVTGKGTKRPVKFEPSGQLVQVGEDAPGYLRKLDKEVLTKCINQLIKRRILCFNKEVIELTHDILATLLNNKRGDDAHLANIHYDLLLTYFDDYQRAPEKGKYISPKLISDIEHYWDILEPLLGEELEQFFKGQALLDKEEKLKQKEKLRPGFQKISSRLSLDDQKLFLGLFLQYGQAYNLGHIGNNQVSPVSLKDKLINDINDVIFQLSIGYPIHSTIEHLKNKPITKEPLPTHIKRTISLLIGLRWYFERNEEEIYRKVAMEDVLKIRAEYNIIGNHFVPFPEKTPWSLCYPLLLVQAVRFSQIEWDNHDYCYEYFSAMRSFHELGNLFDKLSPSGEEKFAFQKILLIFTRLIRWFTLNGQFCRGSSSFNTHHPGLELNHKEKELLQIILFTDELLRKDKYKVENQIKEYIRQGEIEKLFENPEWEEIAEEIYNHDFQEKLKFLNTATVEEQELNLFSNLTIRQPQENEIFNESLRRKLPPVVRNKEGIAHFAINKTQRQMGILRKLEEQFTGGIKKANIADYFFIQHLETLPETGAGQILSPEEKIYLVYVKPFRVLELIHGFEYSAKDPEPETAIDFLALAFQKAFKNYEGTLPLPIVHFILNLLPYFDVPRLEKNDGLPGSFKQSFEAKILFDGKPMINFWLPEVNDGGQQLKQHKLKLTGDYSITILEILERFIHYSVTNYGMIKKYSHVDLDFSASVHFEGRFWETALEKNKKVYGVHVFERYLEDCGSNILETSYSLQLYKSFLQLRKLATPHRVDLFPDFLNREKYGKKKITLKDNLLSKYLLGIDIGATGIKMKFFRIDDKIRDEKDCYDFFRVNELADMNKASTKLFLVPEPRDYVVPTTRPNDKFKNANDFAAYILDTLKKQVDKYKADNIWGKYCHNLISIGVAWPGPIKQNKVATTSGILRNFEGFTHIILDSHRNQITEVDLADAFQQEWARTAGTTNPVTVAIANDGDVEAAGFIFGTVNSLNKEKEKMAGNLKKIMEKGNNVAILKMGTGTAGAILVDGRISGLNEFGKIIVNLSADNRENEELADKKDFTHIWAKGDVNKFFSVAFLKQEAEKAGVPKSAIKDFTGWDVDLLFHKDEKSGKQVLKNEVTDECKKLFGALELIQLAQPNIKWENIVDKKGNVKEDILLLHDENKGFIVAEKSSENTKKEESTLAALARSFNTQTLQSSGEAPHNLDSLLSSLGATRMARFNIEKLITDADSRKILGQIGESMGKRLADIIGILHKIVPLDLIILAGGPLKSEPIGLGCEEGLKGAVGGYLHDRFFGGFENLEGAKEDDIDNVREKKIYYYRQGSDNALLGTAMLGFDHFVNDRKLAELQAIAKQKGGFILEKPLFLSLAEAEAFIKSNASRLRITYNPITKTISRVNIEA
ncbi:MAG: hypothetical protein H6557_07320 [Lewinellaceae bacterium]|nr:hypothetical protein [Phaeodactylibacter sp.]MCB9036412.1 hypothetical protein [Lewinellaceae bacterium]